MRLGIAGLLAVAGLIALALSAAGGPDRDAPPLVRESCEAARPATRPLVLAWRLNTSPVGCLTYGRPTDLRCAGPGVHPTDTALEKVRSATLRLINRERRRRGLAALGPNARLREAAERHAGRMVRRLFFSHRGPRGGDVGDRVERTGYLGSSETWRLAENIGWGAGPRAAPKAMVRAWMNSPPHRAAILGPGYREAGIAVMRGAPRERMGCAATYTAVFGRR